MTQAANRQFVLCPGPDSLAQRAAEWIIDASRKAVAARDRFTLALAGGSTPEKAYALLAQPGSVERIDWSRTYLFFGDERFVPLDDPRSNHAMASRALLAHAPIPADHVFPIPTDRPSAAESAAEYARTLAGFFHTTPDQGVPRFDLILLGMGDDGHTASLFPGKPTLHEQSAWTTASPPGVLPPPVERVTLTVSRTERRPRGAVPGRGGKESGRAARHPRGPGRRGAPAGLGRPSDGRDAGLARDDAAAQMLSRRG